MSLRSQYQVLNLFSDFPWEEVEAEFEKLSQFMSFPDYLSEKCELGDCPDYLVEIAFYLYAKNHGPGLNHEIQDGWSLNPTAQFLHLRYDIPRMLKEAHQGEVNIIENDICLCVYQNLNLEACEVYLSQEDLKILSEFETVKLNLFPGSESFVKNQLILKGPA